MAKIIGNTTATPMLVPDFAQIDERKADYVKNKKMSYIEDDVGYATETYVSERLGDIETALDSIIAIQNNLMGVSE